MSAFAKTVPSRSTGFQDINKKIMNYSLQEYIYLIFVVKELIVDF